MLVTEESITLFRDVYNYNSRQESKSKEKFFLLLRYFTKLPPYSTVTDFAKLRGQSTSRPRNWAMWNESN